MGYYAVVVPAYTGHLNPMTVLGRALQRRGHRVTFLSTRNAEAKARRAGLEFIPIAELEFPDGEWERWSDAMGRFTGYKALRCAGGTLARLARGIIRDLPAIAQHEHFDGVVMDQISLGTEAVCEALKLPLAVACNALMMNPEWGVPPSICGWSYSPSPAAHLRNLWGYAINNSSGIPLLKEIIPYRLRNRLRPMGPAHMNGLPPSLVQVSQQPASFDFPRRHLPRHFHYTGPWTEPRAREEVDFPWSRLDGRRIVYASLGTLQNKLPHLFQTIAEACAGLDMQLVLSLGHKPAAMPGPFAGDPIVVGYAPQPALLKGAALVITHAGLNTVLECILEGVPMVAMPITNDQPGVAARVHHLGLGKHIPLKQVTPSRLRETIEHLRASPQYGERARKLAAEIRRIDGPQKAALLIECAFTTQRPVFSAAGTS